MQLVLMKQHHAHLDILKGIAIAMVAMGHVFLDMPRNPAFHVICSVHMPIFMLVSGYLSARPLPTSSKEVLSYWSKKVIQLLLPLLSLPLIYCIIFAKPLDELVFGVYHAGYWYTLALFFVFVVFFLFRYIDPKVNASSNVIVSLIGAGLSVLFVIGIDYALALLPDQRIYTALSWSQVTWLYPYFLLGYYLHKLPLLEKLWSNRYIVACSAIVYLCLIYVEYNGYKPLRGIPATLSGLCFVYSVAQHLASRTDALSTRLLSYLGRNSLPIYLTHYFFVFSTPSLIGRLNIVEYGRSFGIELFVVLITVAIIMSLTLATIAIVRSNSLLAMLFYGERASR